MRSYFYLLLLGSMSFACSHAMGADSAKANPPVAQSSSTEQTDDDDMEAPDSMPFLGGPDMRGAPAGQAGMGRGPCAQGMGRNGGVGPQGMGQGMGPGGNGAAFQQCGMPPQGPRGRAFDPRGTGMGHGFGMQIPEELRTRMENVRKQRAQLYDAWQKAVLERGDNTISKVRDDFAKTNAAQIEQVRKESAAIREDMTALRQGFMPMDDDDRAGNCFAGGPGAGVRASIDAEIVERINALKTPLTVEAFAKIERDVLSRYKDEIRNDMGDVFMDRPGMPPPMMRPELARMRDEMGNLRMASRADRRELRNHIREAMKIEDPAKREAAIRKILDEAFAKADAKAEARKSDK